jgi:hypothetical protein
MTSVPHIYPLPIASSIDLPTLFLFTMSNNRCIARMVSSARRTVSSTILIFALIVVIGSGSYSSFSAVASSTSFVVLGVEAFSANNNFFSPSLHHHQHHHGHAKFVKVASSLRSRSSLVVVLQSSDTTNVEHDGRDPSSAMRTESQPHLSREDKSFVSSLFHKKDENSSTLENAISDVLQDMSPGLLVALQMAAKTGEWNQDENDDDDNNFSNQMVQVGTALQNVLDVRLRSGRTLLTELLNSGEIRKLDSLIGKAAREGKLDMSFFSVLSMNMQDAAMEGGSANNNNNNSNDDEKVVQEPIIMNGDGGDEGSSNNNNSANRAQILQHIYTRCQEELEKNVPPGMGLLNKLLRTEISSIRTNQLQYYLGPQATSITSPDGKTIELNNGSGGKALVSHGEFITALSQAVNQIRSLEKAGGTDRLSAMNLIENIRRVAMEARVVLVDSYGEGSEVVSEFQRDLQPVFRPSSGSGMVESSTSSSSSSSQ